MLYEVWQFDLAIDVAVYKLAFSHMLNVSLGFGKVRDVILEIILICIEFCLELGKLFQIFLKLFFEKTLILHLFDYPIDFFLIIITIRVLFNCFICTYIHHF